MGRRPSHADVMARFPAQSGRGPGRTARDRLRAGGGGGRPASSGHPGVTILPPRGTVGSRARWPVLAPRLTLQRLIGAGRMGRSTWRGITRSAARGRRQVPEEDAASRIRIVRRFIGEAQTVAALHPSPHRRDPGGWVAPPPVRIFSSWISSMVPTWRSVARTRPITVGEALCWSIEVLSGPRACASRRASSTAISSPPTSCSVHREGSVSTDFGLARSLRGPTPWAAEIEGTAPFMAPEQASPWWGRIDQRTDVYGIGVGPVHTPGRPPAPYRPTAAGHPHRCHRPGAGRFLERTSSRPSGTDSARSAGSVSQGRRRSDFRPVREVREVLASLS